MTAATKAARPPRRGLLARLAAIDDGKIIRSAFFLMLIGTASVLYIDYKEMAADDVSAVGLPSLPGLPNLPFLNPGAPSHPGPEVTTDRAILEAPLTIELASGGVLQLTGTIDLGAADRFVAEVRARGEYVTTVALNSPGGSLRDAIAIGEALHKAGLSTSVAKGGLCASSCPLIFAAGIDRVAEPGAAVGVHQFSAFVADGALTEKPRAAGTAMSDAQKTTAEITRYLGRMGVDPALWIHALETPPNDIYFLTPEEMREYRLVTPKVALTPASS